MPNQENENKFESLINQFPYCEGINCAVKDDCGYHLTTNRKEKIIITDMSFEDRCIHFSSATLISGLTEIFEE